MRIAVNTRLLLKNRLEGIGFFTYESFRRITKQHPEHQFIFLFDRPFSPEFIFSGNIEPHVLFPPARHPFLYYCWFEYSVPRALQKFQADAFISPDGFVSLASDVRTLGVIHDIYFQHRPQDLTFFMRKYYRYFFPRFARLLDRIATVSAYSKKDIVDTYGIDPGKIDVVYNGYNEMYGPNTAKEKESTRTKYARGCPYFLYVGSLNPRKNIVHMLKAFDQFKKSERGNMKLVIVGERMNAANNSDIDAAFRTLEAGDEILFTGRLPEVELKQVLASAEALVYVSFFEGFGIPLLEAMVSGTPVITSNVTSMPEVVNDAGLLVDPHSVDSIAGAMLSIVKDVNLRAALVEKGAKRVKDFSWQKTSENLWSSFGKMMEFNR